MDLLEKFVPKKKKNFSINQCGKKDEEILHTCRKKAMGRGGVGDCIPVNLKISEPSVLGKKKKPLDINPEQPAEKGREKTTKKNPDINPGQPAGKGRKKKKKEKKERRWRWNELQWRWQHRRRQLLSRKEREKKKKKRKKKKKKKKRGPVRLSVEVPKSRWGPRQTDAHRQDNSYSRYYYIFLCKNTGF